jgi:hypothetical protein
MNIPREVEQLRSQVNGLLKRMPRYEAGSWTPSYTGFSVDPVQTCTYTLIGRLCWLTVGVWTVEGTSNATGYTLTAPITAAADSSYTYFPVRFLDNSTGSATSGMARITPGTTTITLFTNWAGALWTASGTKAASFGLYYRV